jgi:hypothetical protein
MSLLQRWTPKTAIPASLFALLLASCNSTSTQNLPTLTPASSTCGTSATQATPAPPSGPPAVASLTDPTTKTPSVKQITFYGDLLPILNSVQTGAVYKCTTCHANYATPDGMNSQDELNRVVQSMQDGSMPRSGQLVPQALIDEFKVWGVEGFPPGDPSSTPAQLSSAQLAAAQAASANSGAPCTPAPASGPTKPSF